MQNADSAVRKAKTTLFSLLFGLCLNLTNESKGLERL